YTSLYLLHYTRSRKTHAHTHTHTHTHAHPRTRAHAHTHTRTHARTHTHTHKDASFYLTARQLIIYLMFLTNTRQKHSIITLFYYDHVALMLSKTIDKAKCFP